MSAAKKRAATWGEAHRREATRRTYEIAAELASGDEEDDAFAVACSIRWCDTEARWRDMLDPVLSPARISREVRRVDGLTTGRLVRETAYAVRSPGGSVEWQTEEQARVWLSDHAPRDAKLIRITRIRKAATR